MARFFKKRNEILGKRPGELVYIGRNTDSEPALEEIVYSADTFDRKSYKNTEDVGPPAAEKIQWLNITGISNIEFMRSLESKFSIQPLILADIMNTGTRPKYVNGDSALFFTLKMLNYEKKTGKIVSEQLSLIVGDNTLITFQEAAGDVFDPVRERFDHSENKIRQSGTGYLLYSLIDSVADNYMAILQIIAESIETVEEELLELPDQETLKAIIRHKKELLYLGKSIRPMREALKLMTAENPALIESSKDYFSDLGSNLNQIIETIDIYKEILNQQQSTYDTHINNRLNEIMKFLTVFSVIFLPMTLIVGIYGTNFDFIPELHFRFGYLMLWALLFLSTVIMLIVFRKKKWI